ncbi:MAG: hypothetical protein N3E37_02560 [Candidatus Micrarchaeota archaeon]|nr:hypothetical protein [Candidatus Micrarchaeota archaeon]
MKLTSKRTNLDSTNVNRQLKKLVPLLESFSVIGSSTVMVKNSLLGKQLEDTIYYTIYTYRNAILRTSEKNSDAQHSFKKVAEVTFKQKTAIIIYEKINSSESLYIALPEKRIAIRIPISCNQIKNDITISRNEDGALKYNVIL